MNNSTDDLFWSLSASEANARERAALLLKWVATLGYATLVAAMAVLAGGYYTASIFAFVLALAAGCFAWGR